MIETTDGKCYTSSATKNNAKYLDDETKEAVASFLDTTTRQDMGLVEQKFKENQGKVAKQIWNVRGVVNKLRTMEHSKAADGGHQLSSNDRLRIENEYLVKVNEDLHLKLYKPVGMLEVEEDYSVGLESKIETLEEKIQRLETKLQERDDTIHRLSHESENRSDVKRTKEDEEMVDYDVQLIDEYEGEGFIGDLASLMSTGESTRSLDIYSSDDESSNSGGKSGDAPIVNGSIGAGGKVQFIRGLNKVIVATPSKCNKSSSKKKKSRKQLKRTPSRKGNFDDDLDTTSITCSSDSSVSSSGSSPKSSKIKRKGQNGKVGRPLISRKESKEERE